MSRKLGSKGRGHRPGHLVYCLLRQIGAITFAGTPTCQIDARKSVQPESRRKNQREIESKKKKRDTGETGHLDPLGAGPSTPPPGTCLCTRSVSVSESA